MDNSLEEEHNSSLLMQYSFKKQGFAKQAGNNSLKERRICLQEMRYPSKTVLHPPEEINSSFEEQHFSLEEMPCSFEEMCFFFYAFAIILINK